MGLDIAEMAIEVEEIFGIEIREEEGVSLTTVGALADYVCDRVKALPPREERLEKALTKLRVFLKEHAGVNPEDIQPSIELASLLPDRAQRRRVWRELRRSVGRGIGPLELSLRVRRPLDFLAKLAAAITFLVTFGLSAHMWAQPSHNWLAVVGKIFGTVAGLFLGIVAGALCLFGYEILILAPLRHCFASRFPYVTVGEILNNFPGGFRFEGEAWTVDQVEAKIRQIMHEVADAPLHEITREKRFVEDLGLG